MRRPNKPTNRKQRRNAFGQFAGPKPRKRRTEVTVSKSWVYPTTPTAKTPFGKFREGETIDQRNANALQADLERGQTLPEPIQGLVHQPIERTLWQRLCGYLRGSR